MEEADQCMRVDGCKPVHMMNEEQRDRQARLSLYIQG